MKKTAFLMIVLMVTFLASAAVAADKGEEMVGRLFLFQKCDPVVNSDTAKYDAFGCPTVAEGALPEPWPIIPDNRRYGQMKYNLLGPEFGFSFQGKNLDPGMDYTLIYYPDPWPGNGLICLGSGTANPSGNMQIHGDALIMEGLPVSADANHTPIPPSGAVGAKIWLVLSDDVACTEDATTDPPTLAHMIGWNPASYLFEGNLIVYQYMGALLDDEAESDDDGDVENPEPEEVSVPGPPQDRGNNGQGKAKGQNK